MAGEQMAPQAAAPQQGGGDMMEGVQAIGDGLAQLQQGLSEAGAPKELLAPLQAAMSAYEEFTSALTGGPQGQPTQGTVDQSTGGNPNAVPA